MKKIIVSIMALALGVGAMAKTVDELVSETQKLMASGVAIYNAAEEVYQANQADVAEFYSTWKTSEFFAFGNTEEVNKKLEKMSKADREAIAIKNQLCARYVIANSAYEDCYRGALTNCTYRACKYFFAKNSNFYQSLKSEGFVVDGKKLGMYQIAEIALFAEDYEQTVEFVSVYRNASYYKNVLKALVRLNDVELAKRICTEIENHYLETGQAEHENYKTASVLNRALTSRIAEAKLLGK